MDDKDMLSIKCDEFTKKEWKENCREIVEQLDAELIVGIRKMKFDTDNWTVELTERV